MPHNTRSIRRTLLGATALAGALSMFAASAGAEESAFQFDQPSQPLSAALRAYSATADQEIIFADALVAGRRAPELKGAYTADAALVALLDGTGLTVSRTGTGVLLVQRADADPQGGSAGGSEVEALIVTAQKREEDIQDVPIAISAFSQEALETHQIAGGPDLITQVPNMTFTKTNFSSYSIQLRGIGTQAISATTDPGVAVAFNNSPFIQNRFFEQEFYDLQRVEVLRGPQGTLYGRNATAGVVNIISQKPKFVYEAKASGDLANYNTTRIEGMVNIPLVQDVAAIRLAGAWTKRDGYAFNEITGSPIDGRDLWSTRVSLRVSPNSAFELNLIWEHFEEDDDRLRSGKQLCKKHVVTEVGDVPVAFFNQPLNDNNISALWVAVQPRLSQGCVRSSLYSEEAFQTPNGAAVPYYLPLGAIGLPIPHTTTGVELFDPYASQVQSRDLRVIESTIDPEYRAEADLGELLINWNITDTLTLASETGYAVDFVYSMQDFNRFNTVEGIFYPEVGDVVAANILSPEGEWCDPQLGCSSRLIAVDVATAESRQFNQEFRLSSDYEGPFNFSLGANFTRFDLEAKYYVFINTVTLASVNGGAYSATHPYVPGVSDNRECMPHGLLPGNFEEGDDRRGGGYRCVYVEQNSIHDIQDQGHNYFLSRNPYKLISYAVFGEAYYNITDALKVTAGLRWTVDKKEAPRIPSWVVVALSRGYPTMEVTEQEWREPTGRLTIDWKPDLAFTDETLLYGSYAHGYKAGGANPPPFVNPLGPGSFSNEPVDPAIQFASATRPKTFDPEFVDAFELGAKNTLADGRVTLNLAAFYYDYEGYQISEIVDRSAYNQNYDAKIWGIEIEADWRPLENLRLGFKGGYENTQIADGEQAIDLIDRTAGNPDWVIVRPFPTNPSSCILPTAMFSHTGSLPQGPGEEPIELNGLNPSNQIFDLGGSGGNSSGGCEFAYLMGWDPVTAGPYAPWPTETGPGSSPQLGKWPPGTYPGWNPEWAPNNGEGFFKDLGGNPLPNAPDFTATLSVDYTLPLAGDWLVTLHTDLYWQSESNWRIFDDHEYNKIDEYFTTNIAAIFNNEEDGWRVLAYVKNVFDRDSITGAFLNSDDTGLTTNVFLTEPRLYGLRVTKAWTGGPLLGSFGERRDGPYPFTVELGGQVQRHDAPNATVEPSFMDQFSDAIDPLVDQQDELDWGDGRDVKLTYRPNDAWRLSLGARFGKTNGSMPWSTREEVGAKFCDTFFEACQGEFYGFEQFPYSYRYNYTISSTTDREEHLLVDFLIGKEVGFGMLDESVVSAGVRYADLESTTDAHVFGRTNWDYPLGTKYAGPPYVGGPFEHDRYEAMLDATRALKGAGPVLSWDASMALLGNAEAGVLGLDWSLSGGVLFGERETTITGEELAEHFSMAAVSDDHFPTSTTPLPDIDVHRSEDVTVPTFGASLGVSYKVDRFAIGAGYRWETYQDAIDGGYAEAQEEDRTIDGPYFKLSVGFGG